MSKVKEELADITNPLRKTGGLGEAVEGMDVFIGLSRPKLLTPEMVKRMAKDPIIFAMSNPEPEIMPNLAKKARAAIVATGRSDFPNQVNNVLAFPGLFRGVFDAGIKKITDEIKIVAAETIANHLTNPTADEIIPNALDRDVGKKVAKAIIQLKG